MPTEVKVIAVLNVVSTVAIGVVAVCMFAGGGILSGVFPEREVHEMVLVPVSPEEARLLRRVPDLKTAAAELQRRADVPSEYRANNVIPSRWVTMPDGSVRLLRND